jgi:hypothetical protein
MDGSLGSYDMCAADLKAYYVFQQDFQKWKNMLDFCLGNLC